MKDMRFKLHVSSRLIEIVGGKKINLDKKEKKKKAKLNPEERILICSISGILSRSQKMSQENANIIFVGFEPNHYSLS